MTFLRNTLGSENILLDDISSNLQEISLRGIHVNYFNAFFIV